MASVAMPSVPADLHELLMTWRLREAREDIDFKERWTYEAGWTLEQKYGVGDLAERADVLNDTISRLQRRAGKRGVERRNELVAVLLDEKFRAESLARRTSDAVSLRKLAKRNEHIRRQLIAHLWYVIDMHTSLREAAERFAKRKGVPLTPNPVPVYFAALRTLIAPNDEPALQELFGSDDRDQLMTLASHVRRNPRGNPKTKAAAEARNRLKALGVSAEDSRALLYAVGLLPKTQSSQ